MNQFSFGYGLKLEKPKLSDAKFGAIFKQVLPPKDWRPFAPHGEAQLNSQFCVNFSYCNCVETMANYQKFEHQLEEFNLSDRWSAVKSGTKDGNTPQKVANAGNNFGNVLEEDCPWGQFWLENPGTYWDEIQDLSQVKPHQIYEGPNWSLVDTDIQNLKNALAYSPLQIGVIVGETWNDDVIKRPLQQFGGHAVELLWIDSQYMWIYDSYPPFLKKLTLDYSVLVAVSFAKLPDNWMELNMIEPKEITLRKRLIDALKNLVSLYQQLIFKIQYGRDKFTGVKRTSDCLKAMREYKKTHPACEISGSRKKVEPHHIFPVHLFPDKATGPFICLTRDLHLWMAHLGNFKKYNPDIEKDARIWYDKINQS